MNQKCLGTNKMRLKLIEQLLYLQVFTFISSNFNNKLYAIGIIYPLLTDKVQVVTSQ